jgi:hypothetical protein
MGKKCVLLVLFKLTLNVALNALLADCPIASVKKRDLSAKNGWSAGNPLFLRQSHSHLGQRSQ